MLSPAAIRKLSIPVSAGQQLAELCYLQGRFESNQALSRDLMAAMAVKSRQSTLDVMMPASDASTPFNYRAGLDYIQSLDASLTLQASHIRQLHFHLNPLGGQWRRLKLSIERRDRPGQKLQVKACKPPVEDLLTTALEQHKLALTNSVDPFIAVPMLALEIMQLFPFLDGNRRVAILVARHLLDSNGCSIVNYADIESEFIATEKTFYRALFQASPNHDTADYGPWLGYWWVILKRLYQRVDRQVQLAGISPGRGSKTALVERYVKQQRQPFSFGDACSAFPTISPDMIRTVLRDLQSRDIIRSEGRGRGARWIKVNPGIRTPVPGISISEY